MGRHIGCAMIVCDCFSYYFSIVLVVIIVVAFVCQFTVCIVNNKSCCFFRIPTVVGRLHKFSRDAGSFDI